MRILSRRPRTTPPDGGIPPSAIPSPRRTPTWPQIAGDDDRISFRLPPENRDLLTAYPDAPAPGPRRFLAAMALAAAARRSGCRILAASREFEFEAAVGQNLAMLADQDHA